MSTLNGDLLKLKLSKGETFTTTSNNLFKGTIQASQGFMMANEANLLLTCEVVDSDPTGHFIPGIGAGNGKPEMQPESLIRRFTSESIAQGPITDSNDVGIIKDVIGFYTKSDDDINAKALYNGKVQTDVFGRRYSPFRNTVYLNEPGESITGWTLANGVNDLPPNKTNDVEIKMSELDDFLKVNMYPLPVEGDYTMNFEFELANKVAYYSDLLDTSLQLAGLDLSVATPNTFTTSEPYYDPRHFPYHLGEKMKVTACLDVSAGAIDEFSYFTQPMTNNFAVGNYTVSGSELSGGTGTGLVLNVSVEEVTIPDAPPLVTVAATNGGADYLCTDRITVSGSTLGAGDDTVQLVVLPTKVGTPANFELIEGYITGLSHNETTGIITINFSNDFDTVVGGTANDVTIFPVDVSGTPSIRIKDIYVRAPFTQLGDLSKTQSEALMSTLKAGYDVPYLRHVVYKDNASGLQFQKTLNSVPQSAVGMMIFMSDGGMPLTPIKNNQGTLMIQQNGINLWETPVSATSPSYLSGIQRMLQKMGMQVRNLDEDFHPVDDTEYVTADKPLVWMFPLHYYDGPSTIQIDLQSNGSPFGTATIYSVVFYQDLKKVKMA